MAIDFNNVNGSAKKSEVKYMKLAEGDNTFRILPKSIMPSYTYWVHGANGKDIPFEALQFDPETEKFDNSAACPVSEAKLKDAQGKDLRCKWAYKCQVINKATGAIEVLQLKKGMLNEIISVAQQLGFDPTDLDSGSWLTVTKKKTGPLAYNVEYSLKQLMVKQSALSDEDKAMVAEVKSMDELFPRETYEKQKARLHKHLVGADSVDATQTGGVDIDKEAVSDLD